MHRRLAPIIKSTLSCCVGGGVHLIGVSQLLLHIEQSNIHEMITRDYLMILYILKIVV